MTFKSNYQASHTGVSTSSGRGGTRMGGMPVMVGGGGLGTLLLIGLFLLLGGGGSPAPQQPGQGQHANGGYANDAGGYNLDHCKTGEDANKYADCRASATFDSLTKIWPTMLKEQAGVAYRAPKMTLFQNSVRTGCGMASSSTGPFYCPSDETIYLDTSFFKDLERLGGSSGPLAQEYVVAHEFGHHIQKLEDTLGLSDYNKPGEDSAAVAIEVQADCYAGLWAYHADKGPDAILEPITQDQLKDAIQTAQAIGDDHIQKHSGQNVNPDLWTHGSSEQRQRLFTNGYDSGKMAKCDTLNRGVYKG
ncbi:neutral zinc metallopeptidase [Corynebacterium aquatimens]|uniref:Metalloprotease n=1 Tax=Corynebacterium aquatimens TaxID=1190508 RepID=A0A931GXJ2_9CORY|nr:neutral zinc metallopeptidase [Corynebacterium aquatimens]MBG6121709.1 putative metalloprotease [Corynebacterium aquatimens]